MNKKPQENWDGLFEQLPLDTAPHDEHRSELKERVLAAFDEKQSAGPEDVRSDLEIRPSEDSGFKKLGRILMTNKAHYWTAAAILVGTIVWLGQGGNTAFAFEELVKNIGGCRTARYDGVFMQDGKVKSTQKNFYMAPGRSRSEMDGMTTIHGADRIVILSDADKEATVMEFKAGNTPPGVNLSLIHI